MRISDWSSYVCSSDLLGKGARSARIEADRDDRLIALRVIALLRVDQLFAADHHLAAQHFERRAIAFARGIGDDLAAHRHAAGRGLGRVGMGWRGRASCRERVCQDGEIPVVAVSIKKKKK